MKYKSKALIILIFISFLIVVSNQTSFAQRKLTKTERKLVNKKDLSKIEFLILLEKGLTLEKIEETPTDELKKEYLGEKINLVYLYKDCNEKLLQSEKKVNELDSINKILKERIKALENKNNNK
ncbi:MAG: hypothetical protein K8R54_08225 [Bacteroidales bacterium]|nr:hypothetical protein [Bacteroidales bacterium]